MYALSVLRGSDEAVHAVEEALQFYTCGMNPKYGTTNVASSFLSALTGSMTSSEATSSDDSMDDSMDDSTDDSTDDSMDDSASVNEADSAESDGTENVTEDASIDGSSTTANMDMDDDEWSASFYCANAPQSEDMSCDLERNLDGANKHGFFYCCAKYSLTSHGRAYLLDVYGDSDMGKL